MKEVDFFCMESSLYICTDELFYFQLILCAETHAEAYYLNLFTPSSIVGLGRNADS